MTTGNQAFQRPIGCFRTLHRFPRLRRSIAESKSLRSSSIQQMQKLTIPLFFHPTPGYEPQGR